MKKSLREMYEGVKKFFIRLGGREPIENPFPVIDEFMKEHGLSLYPTSRRNCYVICGFERCPDRLISIDYDPSDYSLFCAVVSRKYDCLLQRGTPKNIGQVISQLTDMVNGAEEYTF